MDQSSIARTFGLFKLNQLNSMSLFSTHRGVWAAGLVLILTLGCSKSSSDTTTPQPTATACQVQKITYNTGEYELYTFDANGFLTGYAGYYVDQNGKTPATITPDKYTYNAQGLLDRDTYGTGTGYEQYSYTNGALSKIEVFMGGKVVYQIDVTTDASKRITAMKSTNVANDPAYSDGYSTKYTLDAQGRYTRMEASNADGIIYTTEWSAFDPAIQSPWKTLKGMVVYPGTPFDSYGTTPPVDAAMPAKEVDFYAYDDTGKFVGLKKAFDATVTRVANSNNYPITRKDVDAVSGTTYSRTYAYSNCN